MQPDFIPYGRQSISDQDITAVIEVLRSPFLTQGPAIEGFEQAVAKYCGAQYAVAVSSATAGLHLACLALGLGAGDRLWTSPNTFVASANCGLYCGAAVNFVDINRRTYNLDVAALEQRLIRAAQQDQLPQVVVPVHFAGQSCEMATIAELAHRFGFQVIEDAAHGIGGYYRGQPIGCCEFSAMAVFSFHPVKIITTGEGGVVVTNRQELYQRLIRLRTHGITRQPDLMTEAAHGAWYYQQLELGYHYRMTDIQAALGTSQMQRLPEFVRQRRALAARYDELLADLPVTLPWQAPDTASSWHLYVIRLNLEQIQQSHRAIFEAMRSAGIGVNLHYIPVHTQPYYQQMGFAWGDFPEAEQYYRAAMSLPLYAGLTLADQDRVVSTLREILV